MLFGKYMKILFKKENVFEYISSPYIKHMRRFKSHRWHRESTLSSLSLWGGYYNKLRKYRNFRYIIVREKAIRVERERMGNYIYIKGTIFNLSHYVNLLKSFLSIWSNFSRANFYIFHVSFVKNMENLSFILLPNPYFKR